MLRCNLNYINGCAFEIFVVLITYNFGIITVNRFFFSVVKTYFFLPLSMAFVETGIRN